MKKTAKKRLRDKLVGGGAGKAFLGLKGVIGKGVDSKGGIQDWENLKPWGLSQSK